MRFLTGKKVPYYWENEDDAENSMTAFVNEAGGLSVAVSEERAMDSHNITFECAAYLTLNDAKRLRDYLIATLKED